MINETLMIEDSEYCFLAPRSRGEFSQIGEKSYMTETLLEEVGIVGKLAISSWLEMNLMIFFYPLHRFLMLCNSH